MDKEEWKQIKDYPSYDVSNLGRIRSWVYFGEKPHILKLSVLVDGRLRFTPRKNGRTYCESVHRTVLTTFVGKCPKGMVACHNNDNCKDNRLLNLRWDTVRANIKDEIDHGLFKRGESHPNAKLNEKQIVEIRNRYANKEKTSDIAKDYGIKRLTVNDICCGRSWSHVGGPITFRKKRIRTDPKLRIR